MPTESQAVSLLEELGLTEYEARCFVALSRVNVASASEISTLSDVPRSRVYDAVDRLHRRGLVDVQQSEPRQYQSLPADAALEHLRNQYGQTLEAADEALSGLHTTNELEEEGAWAISDHDQVTDRIELLLEDATEEVYLLLADENIADQELCDSLEDVAERGANVLIETSDADVRERIESNVPSATVIETSLAANPAELEQKRLGRIVMIDRKAVLISGMSEQARPGRYEETAIWAQGPNHGLVVGLRHLLGERIDHSGQFE